MRTMQAYFDAYLALVYPAQKLPPDQLREVHHAFYAGAEGMFKLLDEIGGDESISEGAGVAILTGIRDELRAYGRQVLRGGA